MYAKRPTAILAAAGYNFHFLLGNKSLNVADRFHLCLPRIIKHRITFWFPGIGQRH
jgi:hypothetical protein